MLTVITAASSRWLTTLAAVKAELGITGNDSDAMLQQWIAESSSAVEQFCNRVFAAEQVSETLRSDRSLRLLQLARWPLIEVTSIIEAGNAPLGAADYEAELPPAHLFRLSGDYRTCWATGKIVVQYWAGYKLPEQNAPPVPDSAQALPAVIQGCCNRIVGLRYAAQKRDPLLKAEETEGIGRSEYWVGGLQQSGSGGLPPDIAEALAAFRMPAIN